MGPFSINRYAACAPRRHRHRLVLFINNFNFERFPTHNSSFSHPGSFQSKEARPSEARLL